MIKLTHIVFFEVVTSTPSILKSHVRLNTCADYLCHLHGNHRHRGSYINLFHCSILYLINDYLELKLVPPRPLERGLGGEALFNHDLFAIYDVNALLQHIESLAVEVVDIIIYLFYFIV